MPDAVTIQNLEIRFEVEGDDDSSPLLRMVDERIEHAFNERQKEKLAAKERSLGDAPGEDT
jgi:hypothetical protein